ncbi:MAG: D-beta-D-heptose 7-phosphate kinase/D-beta-D-heptose 1-phosphate adenosyltransferase [Planctomycetota bacterium]|jgi:D-beta-D-heptose 7-phosphate kinase/D-beta-D-heptose 1-phosphate adenosyltransferase
MSDRELIDIIDRLGTPRVLIVGDLILDRYLTGDVERISPEAPIPVLRARHSEERLGGAGNVAANLRVMEAEVEILGVVGDDESGQQLIKMLKDIGVEVGGCVTDTTRPTTKKTRMVSGVQQILRVDWEAANALDSEFAQQLFDGIEERVKRAGAVILSDYDKGALTKPGVEAVVRAAKAAGVPVLVDPKGRDYTLYRGATLVTPNRKEAEEAIGHAISDLKKLPEYAAELIETADLQAAVITLGPDGIFHYEKGGDSGRVPTVARQVFDVTGAGDTVISQLALALAAGVSLRNAVKLANTAAGIVVGRRGAASVTRTELKAALGQQSRQTGKVVSREELAMLLAEWRRAGNRVAFTNGCFDVLHRGHVEYLGYARSKGDVLIVGVNDDDSVRRLKGETRPVNGIEDRMHVLAALEMVSAVVAFGEDTPKDIIEFVTPDALIKGEDWADKGVVGREWVEQHGGKVHLAPLLAGRSSTAVIEKIKGQEASADS